MSASAVTASVTGAGRASALAGPAARGVAQYLTFILDGAQYALSILVVKEIVEYGRVTVVPMMPAWIRGVINLRGSVIPVMDLSARFGRQPASATKRTCIVVVETNMAGDRHHVGVVVDAVNAVLDISAAEIAPPPSMGGVIRGELISGMGKVEGRFVVILNAERVLAEDELAVSTTVGAPAPPARAA